MDSLSPEKYTTFAKKLNLNMTEFEKCQADPAEIKKIDADLSEGIRIGIAGTPTLYINGRQFDENMTYENLKSNVDKILK
jgi:protein-disulfide isomerase